MPALERAEKALADIGVKLLAIDYGEPEEDVRAFVEETGTGITLLLDPAGTRPERGRSGAYRQPSSSIGPA